MARRAIEAIMARPNKIHIESYFQSECSRDTMKDKGYLECQHRNPSDTLNHLEVLGVRVEGQVLKGDLDIEFGPGTEEAAYLCRALL